MDIYGWDGSLFEDVTEYWTACTLDRRGTGTNTPLTSTEYGVRIHHIFFLD